MEATHTMKRISTVLTGLLILLAGTSLQAGFVFESEANNTIATADNIDAVFTMTSLAIVEDAGGNNISTTTPNATAVGFGLNDVFSPGPNYDYFSFTVTDDGTDGIFDVDSFGNSDTSLFLFDGSGTLLAGSQGSSSLDTGSTTLLDPFLEYTFASAGLYVIGIGGDGASAVDGGITGPGLAAADVYLVTAALSSVPEPATLLLFGAGSAGLLYARRRQRRGSLDESDDDAESSDGVAT